MSATADCQRLERFLQKMGELTDRERQIAEAFVTATEEHIPYTAWTMKLAGYDE